MATTPVYGWPYQGLSDPPNGATLGEGMALGIEATLQSQVATLQALIDFVRNKPIAQLRQSVAQTLTTGVWTSITFTTEVVDTDPAGTGGHSTSVNTSRYTAVYAGYVWLGGGAGFAINATGQRAVRWAVNGTMVDGSSAFLPPGAVFETAVPARGHLVLLGAGSYVELQAWQNSGGNLDTIASLEHACSMAVAWERLT